MAWKRWYVLGGCPCFENAERQERIIVVHRSQWDIDINNKTIKSVLTEFQARDFVKKYIQEHP